MTIEIKNGSDKTTFGVVKIEWAMRAVRLEDDSLVSFDNADDWIMFLKRDTRAAYIYKWGDSEHPEPVSATLKSLKA